MNLQWKIQAKIPHGNGFMWTKLYIWAVNPEDAMREAMVRLPEAIEWLPPENV